MPTLELDSREGKRLFYAESGQKTADSCPVLLIHRAGGSARGWSAQLEALGGSRHCVAVDLPGHGESEGPAASTITEMANIVVEALEQLGLDQVVLSGHSMGGAVALDVALNHPERVRSLLLVSSGAKLRVAQPILQALRNNFELVPALMGNAVFGSETPADLVKELREHIFDAPGEVVVSDMEACDSFNVEDRLKELLIPVHVIVGKDDYLTPPRLGRRLVERTANAELHVIPGAGHMLPMERPETVAELLLALSIEAGDA
jgi:pimeloyl-ACP methyl ester carboxylesterase